MHCKKPQFLLQASSGMPPGMDTHTKSRIALRFWAIKLLLILFCCFLLMPVLGGTGTAFAYNRGNAMSYADQWALSRNSNYPVYSEDCTNFLSQALTAGGYPQVNFNGSTTNDNEWWGYWWGEFSWRSFTHSNSWSVAPDQYTFQRWHTPGGWLQAVVTPSNSAYWSHYDASSMIGGDELFYDWGQGLGISHAAFQVLSGYSQYTSNWYGDLSDQHITDRYHVSWNHIEVNPNWPTTTIYEMHIDDLN